MTIKDRILKHVNEKNWTQQCFARNASGAPVSFLSPQATKWCLSGHIERWYDLGEITTKELLEFYRKFAEVTDSIIAKYNDTHTFEQVMEAVRKC